MKIKFNKTVSAEIWNVGGDDDTEKIFHKNEIIEIESIEPDVRGFVEIVYAGGWAVVPEGSFTVL